MRTWVSDMETGARRLEWVQEVPDILLSRRVLGVGLVSVVRVREEGPCARSQRRCCRFAFVAHGCSDGSKTSRSVSPMFRERTGPVECSVEVRRRREEMCACRPNKGRARSRFGPSAGLRKFDCLLAGPGPARAIGVVGYRV